MPEREELRAWLDSLSDGELTGLLSLARMVRNMNTRLQALEVINDAQAAKPPAKKSKTAD